MKLVVLLISLIFMNNAFACFSPMGGPEYDSQIIITKLDGKNSYRVSVPRYMGDMPNEAEIILAYSAGGAGGIPIYSNNEILKPKVKNELLVADFTIQKKDGEPYIVVMWWPEQSGMCGIQANTSYLRVE
jgi:hypothetical protein